MLFRRVAPRVVRKTYTAGDLIDVDGRPVRLTVNPRARRISLRLDPARREVVAIAPSVRKLADAADFAALRTEWIAAHLDRLPPASPFRPGAVIEIAGAPCRLERAAMRITPRLIPATPTEPARLLAYGEAETYGRAVLRALKAEALHQLTEHTAAYAARLDLPCPPVAVMDARGRWGSCRQPFGGRPAAIRYSWRLILAPAFVLDYVAAHECAHLIQANHGPGFWTLVHELYGDHAAARSWLTTNGARLHAVGQA
jgi:predicted metal-dependent hydrolase